MAASIITLAMISVVAFLLIELPPGDFVDSYVSKKTQGGDVITQEEIQEMRTRLGLDRPICVRYLKWVGGLVKGDFGFSWEYRRPVGDVLAERLPLTFILAFSTLCFTYLIAVPMGIFSAVRQYSPSDHVITILGYVGLALPQFVFALILMYLGHLWFGASVGGLFSPEFEDASWSIAKALDLLAHIWIPVIVLGTAGTAFQLRTMRAVLLDELNKIYVTAARASGLSEFKLLMKYPVRMAINPIVSTLGWELSHIVSGAPIVGIVLSLPDTGPLFVNALLNQDMYLAGTMILIYCGLVIAGTFISDILLMIVDPRIRIGAAN